ncbi:hypothetical protein ES705_48621 [subsurface metagenome]
MIEPKSKITNIIPTMKKGPIKAPKATNRSKSAKIPRIHLTHFLGHCSESDSGLDNRTAMIEIMHMPGAITTVAVF